MRALILPFFFMFLTAAQAQLDYAVVDSVAVRGNRKTRTGFILREMALHSGDTIALADLAEKMRESELMIMNTGLFNWAKVGFRNWKASDNRIFLEVEVEESWYIYPIPFFELADRNFNVWWVEHNRSLDRTNFGIDFTHQNLTGRRDALKASISYGYTRQYQLRYEIPFFNRAKTLGLLTESLFSLNREVNYATIDNRQVFFQDSGQFTYQRFRSTLGISYRKALRETHTLFLAYRQNRITEAVANELNPYFFLDGKTEQRFFSLSYRFQSDHRDNRFYPVEGYFLSLLLEKDGLGVFPDRNGLTLLAYFDQYLPISEKWSASLLARSKYSFIRSRQPYNDNRAIGFNGIDVRGYEYYIIDGLDMLVVNTSLRFNFLNKDIRFGKWVPIDAFRRLPLKLYLAFNSDWGYANDPYEGRVNPFNNRLLYGGGLGIDVVMYYDMVFKIEYSMNHLGETGLFFKFLTSI